MELHPKLIGSMYITQYSKTKSFVCLLGLFPHYLLPMSSTTRFVGNGGLSQNIVLENPARSNESHSPSNNTPCPIGIITPLSSMFISAASISHALLRYVVPGTNSSSFLASQGIGPCVAHPASIMMMRNVTPKLTASGLSGSENINSSPLGFCFIRVANLPWYNRIDRDQPSFPNSLFAARSSSTRSFVLLASHNPNGRQASSPASPKINAFSPSRFILSLFRDTGKRVFVFSGISRFCIHSISAQTPSSTDRVNSTSKQPHNGMDESTLGLRIVAICSWIMYILPKLIVTTLVTTLVENERGRRAHVLRNALSFKRK